MAHVRRKFFDLTTSPAPIVEEALRRIGEIYDIEKSIRGSPPERRLAARQAQSRPRFLRRRVLTLILGPRYAKEIQLHI